MPETVKLNNSLGIIEVDSFGQVSREDSLASLEMINHLLKNMGAKAIVVDVRKQEKCVPSPDNVAKFAASLPKGVRIAMIFAKGHPNDDAFTLMTGTAVSNSVSMRMFTSKDEALKWLAD